MPDLTFVGQIGMAQQKFSKGPLEGRVHKLQVFDSRAFALGGAHSVRFVPVPTAERAHRPSRPGRGAIRGHAAANGEGLHICVCLAFSASAFWITCTLA